jgi:plasmid stabilization system protein ParE
MVRRIKWSDNALKDLQEILKYWILETGSNRYSKKLENKILAYIKILRFFPKLGHNYKETNYRYLIVDDYKVLYEEKDDSILILYIRDTRRNIKDLNYKV